MREYCITECLALTSLIRKLRIRNEKEWVGDSPVHTIISGADAPNKVTLVRRNEGNWHRLQANENQNLVEGREISDEVREDGRHATENFCVDQPDARNTDNPKAWTESKQPFHGHLILEVEFVVLDGAIVPHIHDGHDHHGQHQGHPTSLLHFDEGRR